MTPSELNTNSYFTGLFLLSLRLSGCYSSRFYHVLPITATTSKNSNDSLSISILMSYNVFVVLT